MRTLIKSTLIVAAGMVLITLLFLSSAFAQVAVSGQGGGTTAAEQALIATIAGKANMTGSTTQNFGVATLTIGNIAGLQYFEARGIGAPGCGYGGTNYLVFAPSVIDYANAAYNAGTFTMPISGVFTFKGNIQTGAMSDGEYMLVKMNVNGTPLPEIKQFVSPAAGGTVNQFSYTRAILAGQTVSFTTTTSHATDPALTGTGCSLQMLQER